MSQYRNVGPEQRDQVNPQRAWHDMRRPGEKLGAMLRTPGGSLGPLLVLGVIGFILPALSDLTLLAGLLLTLFIRSYQKAYRLPIKMPVHSAMLDPAELDPRGRKQAAKGTFYLGNDRSTGEEVWLTNRDAGVHMLVLGTTGSGKAQPLWAKVRTPQGWRCLGELRLGDEVCTPDGRGARVTGIFPQGQRDIRAVRLRGQRTAYACDEHLWSARIDALQAIVRTSDLIEALERSAQVELPVSTTPGERHWAPVERIEWHGRHEARCIMLDHPEHLYITDGDVVTHNTEMLLGLCQNSLNQGSGFMFVDGKAQDKIAFKIMDLVRARGRDDDFLCLNFMTGARDIIGPQPSKITNTMNPFAYGSSGMIAQLVVGLMSGSSGGDDMWKDRAISFVEALSPALVYLRDNYGKILDTNEYRKYFELDKVEELAWKGDEKFPGLKQVLDPLANYLINLPGYDRNKMGKKGGQGDDTKLQHGYITMQLSRAFTSLSDTYAHIVRQPLGEVFFPDVVKNRRILVVMLPSLEKNEAETANIGKIVVTALKNIMSEGLGSQLEGDRSVLENDAGRALLAPYLVILDEYGYYAVKGFAVAFAQARSLGFVCVVGGQDLASFQKQSKEEAVSVCGNTRMKAFGSIEDPEQTMDFAIKTGSKTAVARTSSYEGEVGAFNNSYADQMNINLEHIDRINATDVKAQREGQFHLVFGASVVRAATYFVNPPRVKRVQLNHFIQVRPPDQLQVDEIEMVSSGLADRIAELDLTTVEAPPVRDITAAAQGLMLYKDLGVLERSIAAIVHVGRSREAQIAQFRAKVRSEGATARTPQAYQRLADMELADAADPSHATRAKRVEAADALDDELPDPFAILESAQQEREQQRRALLQKEPAGEPQATVASPSGPERAQTDARPSSGRDGYDDEDDFPTTNAFTARTSGGFAAEVFAGADSEHAQRLEAALAEPDDGSPLLNYNATVKGVQSLERALGASDEQAQEQALQVVKEIEDATRYPMSVPKEKSADQVTELLLSLADTLDELNASGN